MMSFPTRPVRRPRVFRAPAAQRGVILVITMVAMVVLLVGLAAVLRSVDTSGLIVGNLAFRRDLTNRAEQAIALAKVTLQATNGIDFTSNVPGSFYSPTKLANGSTGVPAVLDSNDSTTGYKAVYKVDSFSDITGDTSITYRYVIDRQCNTGTTTFSTATCEYISSSSTLGGSSQFSSGDKRISGQTFPIYRISVRVNGPRNSVGYFQTTYVIQR